MRKKISNNKFFIPEMNKGLRESTYENINIFKKLKLLIAESVEKMSLGFTQTMNPDISYARRDVNGNPTYSPSKSFLAKNRAKFDKLFKHTALQLSTIINSINSVTVNGVTTPGKLSIRRSSHVATTNLNNAAVLEILNDIKGVNWTKNQWETHYGQVIPVGEIIYQSAQHQVAVQTSFDLPKLLQIYAWDAIHSIARQQVNPEMIALRDEYQSLGTGIDDQGNVVNKGGRKKANQKNDYWFGKQALGYSMDEIEGNTGVGLTERTKVKDPQTGKIVETKVKPKIYTDMFQKATNKDMEEYLQKYRQYMTQDQIDDIHKEMKSGMKHYYKLGNIIDNTLFWWQRVKGLGYNVSSAVTNIAAGQISNAITAASEIFFPEKNIYIVTMEDLMRLTLTPKAFANHRNNKAALAATLFKAWDIKQDSRNELQKASEVSKATQIVGKANVAFDPYYMLTRGEDFNQIPMFAALLGHEGKYFMKDVNGQSTGVSVLDGMELVKHGNGWVPKVKQQFRNNAENLQWENYGLDGNNVNQTKFADFKLEAEQMIIYGHGDFSKSSGMIIKENILGRALMMFRTYLPSEVKRRFGRRNFNYYTSKWEEGMFTGATPGTYLTYAGLAGLLSLPFLGLGTIPIISSIAIGVGVSSLTGLGIAKIFSTKITHQGDRLNFLAESVMESAIMSGIILQKTIGNIINLPIRTLTLGKQNLYKGLRFGKHTLHTEKLFVHNYSPGGTLHTMLMNKENFDETSLSTWKQNIEQMSLTLTLMTLVFMTKISLWDDEDEKRYEETGMRNTFRRGVHNLLVNKILQIQAELTQWYNLEQAMELLWTIGPKRTLDNIVQLMAQILDPTNNLYLGGQYAGENKVLRTLNKTFVPGVLQAPIMGIDDYLSGDSSEFWEYLGLSNIAERQYDKTPIDRWFNPLKVTEDSKAQFRKKLRLQFEKQFKEEYKQHNFDTPLSKQVLNQYIDNILNQIPDARTLSGMYQVDKQGKVVDFIPIAVEVNPNGTTGKSNLNKDPMEYLYERSKSTREEALIKMEADKFYMKQGTQGFEGIPERQQSTSSSRSRSSRSTRTRR
jgi:hypothetical protein